MSKELPYFKFEPAGWRMGKIQKRSAEAKVAFIDLCCKYWHDECHMTIEDAILDFGDKEINELIQFKVIKTEGGNVRIDFLDVQIDNIQNISKINSINGLKSAEARRKKKAMLEGKSTVVERIPTKEMRGEEIKEETKSTNLRETLLKDLPNSTYIKTIADLNDVSQQKVISLIPAFRKAAELEYPTAAKFYNHFKNWVPKQLVPANETPVKAGYTPKR